MLKELKKECQLDIFNEMVKQHCQMLNCSKVEIPDFIMAQYKIYSVELEDLNNSLFDIYQSCPKCKQDK